MPPLLKVVLFSSLSAPLMKSVPPPKTVVPIAELPLSRFNVPPFSTVSLVRPTAGPGWHRAHGGQSAVDKVAGCRTAARNSLGARNDRRAICAAADGQRAALNTVSLVTVPALTIGEEPRIWSPVEEPPTETVSAPPLRAQKIH